MAAPEQVGIMQEKELTSLHDTLAEALGEEATALGNFPTYFFDPTLLQVEQLRWVNRAVQALVAKADEQPADDEKEQTAEDDEQEEADEPTTPPAATSRTRKRA